MILTKKNAKYMYLCEHNGRNSPISRVVYRGNNNANANGGVAYANTNNDATNANANVGSRLDNYQSAYNKGHECPTSGRGERATAKAQYMWKAGTSSSG